MTNGNEDQVYNKQTKNKNKCEVANGKEDQCIPRYTHNPRQIPIRLVRMHNTGMKTQAEADKKKDRHPRPQHGYEAQHLVISLAPPPLACRILNNLRERERAIIGVGAG